MRFVFLVLVITHKQPLHTPPPQAAAVIDPATHKLTMLYAIRPGACDQSFGVHVADSAGFPPQVLRLGWGGRGCGG